MSNSNGMVIISLDMNPDYWFDRIDKWSPKHSEIKMLSKWICVCRVLYWQHIDWIIGMIFTHTILFIHETNFIFDLVFPFISTFWFSNFALIISISGAFLIPFFVMLILEGIPLFLIELGIGQRMRLGSLGVWNTIHPWLGGIGISSCIVTLFVTLYYNVVITWCFFYLLNSFRVTYLLIPSCCSIVSLSTETESLF